MSLATAMGEIKEKRTKATPEQLTFMVQFMKRHPGFASGRCGTGLQAKLRSEKLWQHLSKQLNSLRGPPKAVSKWRQTWRDLRSNIKKKVTQGGNGMKDYGTDNDIKVKPALTAIEEQVVTLLGPVVLSSMDEDMPTTEPTVRPSAIPKTELDPLVLDAPDLHGMSSSSNDAYLSPSQSPTSSPAAASPNSPQGMHFRKHKRQANFYSNLLDIKERKLLVKQDRNVVEQQKVAAINRLADVLQQIADKLN